ncbi:MAG: caspase family protein [Hyphomicrobiaceae bacterium]|nr:caspase family protein [Hyphomicrobiaceae bacterium]
MRHVAARFLLACAAMAALVGLGAPAALAEQRLALLIGNSRYEVAKPLRNPENDVRLLTKSLETAGFKTFVGLNASHADMGLLIERFLEEADRAENPVVLVFFAGHGVQLAGKNYLVGTDANVGSGDEVIARSFDAEALLARVNAVEPRLSMLVLDACRDDPFENRTRNLAAGLSPMTAAGDRPRFKNQLIAFSTAPGKTALDGDTGVSPYASAFAETVLVPGLDVEGAFRRIRQKVAERTKGQQEPWESSALYETFQFVSVGGGSALSPEEATIWDFASIVNSAESYQRYLDRYPSGTFANLARDKIAAINADFSYMRKAELFPVVQMVYGDFPRCREDGNWLWDIEQKLRKTIAEMNGQIVYVDITFPERIVFCGGLKKRLYYNRLQLIRSAGDTGCTMRQNGDPPDYAVKNVSCLDPGDFRTSRAANGSPVFDVGGRTVEFGDVKLVYPNGDSAFYQTDYNPAEGYIAESWFSVRGLIRVNVETAEIYKTITFIPVEPRDLGLSWKFDNTVAAAAKMREEQETRTAANAEPEAEADEPAAEAESDPEPTYPAPSAPAPSATPQGRAPTPALGWSYEYRTRREAIQTALKSCQGRCRMAIWIRNGCGAIAFGERGGWGAASHRQRKNAEARAIQSCNKVDKRCRVERWVCSRRFGAIAVAQR